MMSDCDRERVRSRRVLTQNAVLFFHTQVAIEKLDVWLTTRRMRSRDLIHMVDGGGKLGAVEGDGRLDSSELRASLGPRIQVMSLSPLRRTFVVTLACGLCARHWRMGSPGVHRLARGASGGAGGGGVVGGRGGAGRRAL